MFRNFLLLVAFVVVGGIGCKVGQHLANDRLAHELEISQIDVEFWQLACSDHQSNSVRQQKDANRWRQIAEANADLLDAVVGVQIIHEDIRVADKWIADNNLVIQCVGTNLDQRLKEWAKEEERSEVK